MKWKKILLRVVLFVIAFAGTALATNYMNYKGYQEVSVEVGKPTLPVVYLKYGDYMVDRMLGYNHAMDTAMMRDVIIPVGEDKQVSILLRHEEAETFADGLSYELRSLDGSSLIESGDLKEGIDSGGYTEFKVSFRMDMTLGQEYVLAVKIKKTEDISFRYYSRIVRLDREYLTDFLAYAYSFHEATFVDKESEEASTEETAEDMITELINPNNKDADTMNLGYVNLDSCYDTITWGNLNPAKISEVIPQVRELDSESAVIMFRYVVESGANGEISDYMVSEYYRLRYDNGANGVVLQDYERYIDTIFEYDSISTEKNSVNLGIYSTDTVLYRTSDDMKKAAFVTAGQLWFYDYKENRIANVYGSGMEGMVDVREFQNQSGLNIISVSDDGVMDFVAYGRIGRGNHEGENGIILYEYAEEDSEITELAFIRCDLPYDILKLQVGKFAYFDRESGIFYVLLNDSVMKLDVATGETSFVVENMPSDYICVSEDGRSIAYPNSSNPLDVTEITIQNYRNGTETVKTSDQGRLSIIGFAGMDLIYGEAQMEHAVIGPDSCPQFLFGHIYITDENGTLIKDYHKEQILISEVDTMEDIIYLTRCMESGDGTIVETSDDYISYKAEDDTEGILIQKVFDEKEYNQTHLVFPTYIYVQSIPKEIMTKEKQNQNVKSILVDGSTNQEVCYVFTNTGLSETYFAVGEAVKQACIEGGIVVDGFGNTIYKLKETASYNTIAGTFSYQNCDTAEESLMACCYMSLLSAGCNADYSKVREIGDWENAFETENRLTGLNLTGIDLETALGYLSDGIPFAVKIDDGSFVLVVSYNSTHIRYYDPVKGQEVKVGRKSFIKNMEQNGNVVYSYIEY